MQVVVSCDISPVKFVVLTLFSMNLGTVLSGHRSGAVRKLR